MFPGGRVEVVATMGGGPNSSAVGPDGFVYITQNGGFQWSEIPTRNGKLTLPGNQVPYSSSPPSLQLCHSKSLALRLRRWVDGWLAGWWVVDDPQALDYPGTGAIQRVDLQSGQVTDLYTHGGESGSLVLPLVSAAFHSQYALHCLVGREVGQWVADIHGLWMDAVNRLARDNPVCSPLPVATAPLCPTVSGGVACRTNAHRGFGRLGAHEALRPERSGVRRERRGFLVH